MNVWIAAGRMYEEWDIYGVFSTEEKAKAEALAGAMRSGQARGVEAFTAVIIPCMIDTPAAGAHGHEPVGEYDWDGEDDD